MPNFRKQPTAWPNAFYYINRFIQFTSSIGVIGINAYFVYNLLKDKMGIPHEFILLVAVSLFSLVNIIVSTVAKCCGALNPKFALSIDFICFAWWGVAFGFLTHAMGPQVWNSCVGGTWGDESGDGPYICRLYKAGWVLALAAVAFFLSSVILDITVIRRNANHKYIPANPKSMQQAKTYNNAPDYTQNTSYGSSGLAAH